MHCLRALVSQTPVASFGCMTFEDPNAAIPCSCGLNISAISGLILKPRSKPTYLLRHETEAGSVV
jgi:hypothetical protein